MARHKRVTADDVITFIERFCIIPDGKLAGQPLKLVDFQVEFLKLVYDNKNGPTRRAILSLARKNAKSSLAAALLLNHLLGPSARDRPNSQLYSTAQSLDQASIIYNIAAKMIRLNPALAAAVRVQEARRTLSCPTLGTTYRALSADSNVAHGLNPQFVVHDELARVRGPRSALYDAMESGSVALQDPLSICISTQAANDGDLFSLLIDDALAGLDPQTVIKLYATPADCEDIYSEAALRAANPGFDHFLNRELLFAEAAKAKRMPSFRATYKNLTLNQRIEVAGAQFAPLDVWRACGGEPMNLHGLTVFGGLDLSSTTDLTALVLGHCDPSTALWHIQCYFWMPADRLTELCRDDKEPYDVLADQGVLRLVPGPTVDREFLAGELLEIFDDHDVRCCMYDRADFKSLLYYLNRVGFPQHYLDAFKECGQGYLTMGPALKDLEYQLYAGKIRHGNNPLLLMCARNAKVETDSTNNRKFSKLRSRGRIDGIVALAMCLAGAPASMTQEIDVRALIA